MDLTDAFKRFLAPLVVLTLAAAVGCGGSDGPAAASARPAEGVSVVYEVEFPPGADPAMLLQQAVDALRERAGARAGDWYIASPGWNELEIVAPVAYEDKQAIDSAVAAIRSVVEPGTLSFHIAADPGFAGGAPALPLQEQQNQRDTFRKSRVKDVGRWQWVPLKDPESIAGSPDVSLAELDSEEVAGLFANQARIIVERDGDRYCALLGNTRESAMTPQQNWSIKSVERQFSPQTGRPIVVFHLDNAGGDILMRLTTANDGKAMAVVVNGEIMMAPVIRGAIGQDVAVTPGGDGFTESEIADMMGAFAREPLPVIVDGPPVAVTSFTAPKTRRAP